jgi:quercetin dioxygenase-like cupin family protein
LKTINPSKASKAPDSIVTGEVYTSMVIAGDEEPKVRVGRVYFAPGARTAWHSHSGGEYLHVLDGTALVQEKDGEVRVLYAGETIYTEPNVEHWHGAAPDSFMVHLAIWGAPAGEDDEAETEWGEQVSDEEAEMPDEE